MANYSQIVETLQSRIDSGAMTFEEAKYTLVCRIVASQEMDPAGFIDASINDCYSGNDYHKMYIGEIISAYEN